MHSLTVDAVGLALDIAQRRAEVASRNVAFANVPGSRMERPDFARANDLLSAVAHGSDVDHADLASVDIRGTTTEAPRGIDAASSVDDEVADLALASAHFQALSEALNRQFGLMSMALSGDQS
jgi:flagellar basal body rod protein FlgB